MAKFVVHIYHVCCHLWSPERIQTIFRTISLIPHVLSLWLLPDVEIRLGHALGGGGLGVVGRFLGSPLWSLGGLWGLPGGTPNGFVMYTMCFEDVSERSLGVRKFDKGGVQ